MRGLTVSVLLLLVLAASARGQTPACGPVPLEAEIPPGERTEILVLGTQHLRRVEGFDPRTLDALLDALEGWRPDAIGVETLPPAQIAAMEAQPAYGPVLEAFAGAELAAGRVERERLGAGWAEASALADSLLDALGRVPATERAGLRRELVPVLAAAYRLDDATLQWSYLDAGDAARAPTASDTLRSILTGRLREPNETTAIGLALARRLDLEVVHPIDDHLDKDLFLAIAEELTDQLESSRAYRELVESGALEASTEELNVAHRTGDLLPFYLDLNERAEQERNLDLEWGLFFRTRLDSGLDRMRVALWEVRNLAMAQHVRRMTAPIPGGRALVVVGASHKPFLDAYLSCGMDVDIVQLAEIVERP